MSGPLRFILFGVDGTLVDSQNAIVRAVALSFKALGLTAPLYEDFFARYKSAFAGLRAENGAAQSPPIFANARAVLHSVWGRPQVLLSVATGKSRRGLDDVLNAHKLSDYFVTVQCADDHPSKSHPAMTRAALAETGVAERNAVMIGDTQFDMEMAAAAGLHAIGVTRGYHGVDRLMAADHIVNDFNQIPDILDALWQEAA